MRNRSRLIGLGLRLHAVMKEGGERKQRILEALAVHWGYTPADFTGAMEELVRAKSVRSRRRQGGIHWAAR